MSALGYSWHQQTVGAVETGVRRVTAEEILGLSWALMTSISELIKPADDDKTVELPDGRPIDAVAVRHSVDGVVTPVIQWDGNTPPAADFSLTVPLTPTFASALAGLEERIAELEAREKAQPEAAQ